MKSLRWSALSGGLQLAEHDFFSVELTGSCP